MFCISKGPSGRHTLLLAPLAALLLASCGGGGNSSTSATSTAATDTASTTDVATAASTDVIAAGSTVGTPASAATAPAPASSPITAGTATTPAAPSTGSGSTTTSVSTSPSTPVTSQVIEYYGDSTIWGYGSGTGVRVATPAPAAFAAALPVSLKATVINEGVNGSTACQLLNGTDGKHPAWDTQMASSKATVIILNHAINDEWIEGLATYRSCLSTLSQKAKQHGKKVVFETPNPTRDSGANGLDVYVNAMKAVAMQEGAPVIDQYKYLSAYLNGQSAYTICPDGLHPTDAVYIMKGKYAASVYPSLGL
jgi:lysophospholipase L1-like esterase